MILLIFSLSMLNIYQTNTIDQPLQFPANTLNTGLLLGSWADEVITKLFFSYQYLA